MTLNLLPNTSTLHSQPTTLRASRLLELRRLATRRQQRLDIIPDRQLDQLRLPTQANPRADPCVRARALERQEWVGMGWVAVQESAGGREDGGIGAFVTLCVTVGGVW